MTKTKKILLWILFLLSMSSCLHSQDRLCFDYQLLDGYEPLEYYGMDSTDNWWAITAPFSNKKRLIVNGNETDVFNQITFPVFSHDGLKWAAFVDNNGSWEIITESGKLDIMATNPGELVYSGVSNDLVFSYFQADMEYIVTKNARFQVINRKGKLYVGPYGQNVAFLGFQGNRIILNINGNQYLNYEEILPIGYWADRKFVYAAKIGNGWEVYKNDEVISEQFYNITEAAINRFGTVAAVVASTFSRFAVVVMFAEEYYEPVYSDNFDSITNLVLHPEVPMMAFAATKYLANFIVLNTARYDGGEFMGIPRFSYDGSELYYIGCDAIDCFLNINGKRLPIFQQFGLDEYFAVAPGTETMAYSTNANLMIRNINTKNLHAGIMTDEMGPPRFNWREGRYEALGAIANRLFLLTCYPK